MSREQDTTITVRIPSELRDKFKLLCQGEGLTMSEYLRNHIEGYCKAYKVEFKIVPNDES